MLNMCCVFGFVRVRPFAKALSMQLAKQEYLCVQSKNQENISKYISIVKQREPVNRLFNPSASKLVQLKNAPNHNTFHNVHVYYNS